MSDLIEALYNTCEGDEESIMYQAADLIEQLQARVVELERSQNELAAHAMRIRWEYYALADFLNMSDNEMINNVRKVMCLHPHESLAERDACTILSVLDKCEQWSCMNTWAVTVDDIQEYAERVRRGEI